MNVVLSVPGGKVKQFITVDIIIKMYFILFRTNDTIDLIELSVTQSQKHRTNEL